MDFKNKPVLIALLSSLVTMIATIFIIYIIMYPSIISLQNKVKILESQNKRLVESQKELINSSSTPRSKKIAEELELLKKERATFLQTWREIQSKRTQTTEGFQITAKINLNDYPQIKTKQLGEPIELQGEIEKIDGESKIIYLKNVSLAIGSGK